MWHFTPSRVVNIIRRFGGVGGGRDVFIFRVKMKVLLYYSSVGGYKYLAKYCACQVSVEGTFGKHLPPYRATKVA
jgi:hypothetical protein